MGTPAPKNSQRLHDDQGAGVFIFRQSMGFVLNHGLVQMGAEQVMVKLFQSLGGEDAARVGCLCHKRQRGMPLYVPQQWSRVPAKSQYPDIRPIPQSFSGI
jgi:hypothetical protein